MAGKADKSRKDGAQTGPDIPGNGLFQTLVEQLPAITYTVRLGKGSVTTYISPQLEDILGFTPDEWLSDPELWIRQLHEDDRQRVVDVVEYSDTSGKSFTLEYRVLDRDGGVHWIRNQSHYLLDKKGHAHTVYGVMVDVTERKRVEEILQSTEDRFRHLFESSPDAIFVEDLEGQVLDVNPVACRLHGMTKEELVGKNVVDLVPPSLRKTVVETFPRWIKGEVSYAKGLSLTSDGREIPVEIRANRITFEGVPALLFHVRDISERQRAEEELRKAHDDLEKRVVLRTSELTEANVRLQKEISERRRAEEREHARSEGLRQVVNVADELLGCEDLDSLYRLAVEAAREQLGVERCAVFLCDGQYMRGTYGTSLQGETTNEYENVFSVETDWVQKLTSLKREEQRTMVVDWPYHEWRDGRSTSEGHGWAAITSIFSGEELIGLFSNDTGISKAPYDPALQEIVFVYCSLLGAIIERKRAEESLRESREQLTQSQKMEALGRLAGGVAHDFNNLLTAILGYGRLVLEESDPQGQVHEDIQEVVTNAQRAADLTQKLLMFGRKQMPEIKSIDLNAVIGDMHQLLRHTLGEDVELITVLGEDVEMVRADKNSIEQVVLNLAVNARDAMPEGGELRIVSSTVTFDDDFSKRHVGVNPGQYATVSVRDTGFGMTEEVRSRIFEPFFTTKPSGQGTGLGLSTVYGIMQQCNGYVEVRSKPGAGTEFKVYFPAVEAERRGESEELSSETAGGSEAILVVEDEEAVRNLIVRMLRGLGYEVIACANGIEGLAACKDRSLKIDLILTDVVMPQMGGVEMIKQAGKLRDDFRILFMTGFTPDALFHRGVVAGDVPVLMKPFTPPVLASKVREVFEAPKMKVLDEDI